jgi:hypothetical protein
MSATRKDLEQVLLLNTQITAEQLEGYRDCDVRQAVKELNERRSAEAASLVATQSNPERAVAVRGDTAAALPRRGAVVAAATTPAPSGILSSIMAPTPLALPVAHGAASASVRKQPPPSHAAVKTPPPKAETSRSPIVATRPPATASASASASASLEECSQRVEGLLQQELIQSLLQSSHALKEACDELQCALLSRTSQVSLAVDLFDEIERECWLHSREHTHARRCQLAFNRWLTLLRQVFVDRQAQGGASVDASVDASASSRTSSFLARFTAKQRALQQLIALEEARAALLFES